VGASIEIIRPDFPCGDFKVAIFDFDGTLSLLRRNWQDVMIPMMVDVLKETGTAETGKQLHDCVEDFVMQLNGRQTIYQMIRLADEVTQRGGRPLDPLEYKRRYHERLWREVGDRVRAVRCGRVPAAQMTVPGSHEMLQCLAERGLDLFLASGTDLDYVRDEVHLLGLAQYFGDHVYGALDDYRRFSKAMIIDRIIHDCGVPGQRILGLGDGFVEIEEVKHVGGTAIGVASNETTRHGINSWKRDRLIRAGADIIIGDYSNRNTLLELLGLRG
jgi:phosphoglycolate phosphatase-like HAD superfamily hydrolase